MDHPYLNELTEKIGFMFISSLISLGIGLLYLKGVILIGSEKRSGSHL